MATGGNNSNMKATELRESFFASEEEREYFTKLMQDPKERKIHADLLAKSAKELYEKAISLIQRVESGEFNEEQMATVEYTIAHCLAAIEDIYMVLEREMTPQL